MAWPFDDKLEPIDLSAIRMLRDAGPDAPGRILAEKINEVVAAANQKKEPKVQLPNDAELRIQALEERVAELLLWQDEMKEWAMEVAVQRAATGAAIARLREKVNALEGHSGLVQGERHIWWSSNCNQAEHGQGAVSGDGVPGQAGGELD